MMNNGDEMTIPEYLLHFGDTGQMTVEVKLISGKALPIREKAMECDNISRLLAPESGNWLTRMTFDEHPYEISRFEIHPRQNKLTIWIFEE